MTRAPSELMHPAPKRGVASDADAERAYRALLNTVRDTDTPTQAELFDTFLGEQLTPWRELPDGVKRFTRALATALGAR